MKIGAHRRRGIFDLAFVNLGLGYIGPHTDEAFCLTLQILTIRVSRLIGRMSLKTIEFVYFSSEKDQSSLSIS